MDCPIPAGPFAVAVVPSTGPLRGTAAQHLRWVVGDLLAGCAGAVATAVLAWAVAPVAADRCQVAEIWVVRAGATVVVAAAAGADGSVGPASTRIWVNWYPPWRRKGYPPFASK